MKMAKSKKMILDLQTSTEHWNNGLTMKMAKSKRTTSVYKWVSSVERMD